MVDALGYLWSALFFGGYIYLTFELGRTAVRGRFWFWSRKANGRTWPPIRSESPIRFWVVWASMAGPIFFITALFLAALLRIAWLELG